MRRRGDRGLVAVALLAALVGCSGGRPEAHPSATATGSPTSVSPPASASLSPSPSIVPSASPSSTSCPSAYADPDPRRPVVQLAVTVAADHRTVTGRETIRFTPEKPVSEIVLRLWANAPRPRSGGGSITLTSARVDGRPVAPALSSGGTLARLPLPAPAVARPVLIELGFRLILPRGVNERMGSSGGTAWMASAFPLLAWEKGVGWATEPATGAFAEATTSEAFQLVLNVSAPAGDQVVAGGEAITSSSFRAPAVRDVMVAVGRFRVAQVMAGSVPVTIAVAPGLPDDPDHLARLHVSGIAAHERRFGPFPYPSLKVAVVPDISGGIEYPGAILLGSGQDRGATLSHEIAHEWFYGLVGNNQGRDPWLDESFATYAEALHRGTASRYLATPIAAAGRNRVGRPMTFWESRRSVYFRSVYVQGAAALLRARAAVGAAAFDAAIKCYVAANAHRVARPAHLAQALAHLPAALTVLRQAGALP